MLYRKINIETGMFIEDCIFSERPMIEQGGVMKLDPRYIDVPVPSGFFHPRWDGKKWVEGLTQEEIAELTKPVLQEPTVEERLQMAEDTIMFMLMGGM